MDVLLFAIPNATWIAKHKSELTDTLWIAASAISVCIMANLGLYLLTYEPLFMTLASILEVVLVSFAGWIAGFSDDKWWLLFNALACTSAILLDPSIYAILNTPIQMNFYQSLVGNTAVFFFGLTGYYLGMVHSYEINLGGVGLRDLLYLIIVSAVAGITVFLYYTYILI